MSNYNYPKVLVITGHGLGDGILSLQCSHFISQLVGKSEVKILSCTRDEVFKPFKHLFGHLFEIEQHKDKEKWADNNWILHNQKEIESIYEKRYYSYLPVQIVNYPEKYYVIPDLLYKNPLAFDFQKYNTNPQVIKQTRLLTDKYRPQKKIYVGLATSTDGYLYNNIPALLRKLAKELPDHEIYFPNLKLWANRELSYGDLSNMPANVTIHEFPDFCESLDIMKTCCLGIYTCNGSSHVAYQLGQPRLLLDPQYNRTLWQARWREDMSECININSSLNDVVSIVKENINTPQSLLLPREKVLEILVRNNYNVDWGKELLFKF